MAKKITIAQLERAFRAAPEEVKREGQEFLLRGLSEYKKVAVVSPWRIGQRGGGIPVATPQTSGYWGGKLKEQHRTKILGLEGRFGVDPNSVPYAKYVHKGTSKMESRPWLDYAKQRADRSVQGHYRVFLDNILKFIAQ